MDQLQAFIYVVELKSVHKASRALYLSQPTVTARIKALERELNVDLFIRQERKLILNQQGKQFLPYARRILQSYREGKHQLTKQRESNEVVIGATEIPSTYFIPHVLSIWKEINPELRFTFIALTKDDIVNLLLNYEIDFAFTGLIAKKEIHQEPLIDNPLRLIVYKDHPFIKKDKITIAELAKDPLVSIENGMFDWNRIHKLFEEEEVEPTIEFQVNQFEVAKSLIKSKQCIGFLPNLCVKEEVSKGELIELDTTHLFEINLDVQLSYVKSRIVDSLKDSIHYSVDQFTLDKTFLST